MQSSGNRLEQIFIIVEQLEQHELKQHCNGLLETFPLNIYKTERSRRSESSYRYVPPNSGSPGISIYSLFSTHKESGCADVRDKVCSPMSLAPSCCRKDVTVDYANSLQEVGRLLIMHELIYHSDIWSYSKVDSMFSSLKRYSLLDNANDLLSLAISSEGGTTSLAGLLCEFLVVVVYTHKELEWHGSVGGVVETVVDHEVSIGTNHPIELGSLVFRLDEFEIVFLRRIDNRLQLVGVGSVGPSRREDEKWRRLKNLIWIWNYLKVNWSQWVV